VERVGREAVAEIRQRVVQAIGQLDACGHGRRLIGEEAGHLLGRLEIPLGVPREAAAGAGEIGPVADAGEHVEERPLVGAAEPDAVGGDNRHVKRGRQLDERLEVGLLVAEQVTLQLDVDVRAAEESDEPIDQAADTKLPAGERLAPDERHEAGRASLELLERERPLPFRRAELHQRHELAEVAVAFTRLHEDRKRIVSGRWSVVGGQPITRATLTTDHWPLTLHASGAIVSSHPMMGRMPAAVAALWKAARRRRRRDPAARAPQPSRRAVDERSGSEAPRGN
jgi:hypothetical protein